MKYIFSENSKIYNLQKIYISKFFKIIFENFEIYISKFLFRKKKFQIIFENLEIYMSRNSKQIFFYKKKFFKFSHQKKNLENSFIFKNLDTSLGKFSFFFRKLIP